MNNLRIVIFDPDAAVVAELKSTFEDVPAVSIVRTERMLYLQPPPGLDVIYLPLAAAERWGAKPLVHKAQILSTSEQDRIGGLPPLIVTGTCLAPGDPRGPIPETALLISTVFEAISKFNDSSTLKIGVVGFWAYNLLKDLTAKQLRQILQQTVPEVLKSD